jgi:F-type H+-transporting ATPase subunit gamma
MKREHELQRRLRATEMLEEAVGAMKSLSAHQFRQARAAALPARDYRDDIERLAAAAGAALSGGSGPTGLLVVGSDLGLCGDYNRRVVALARERRAALGDGPNLCVGRRCRALLGREGISLAHSYAAPTGTSGVTELLLAVAGDLLDLHVRSDLAAFEVVASRFQGVGRSQPATSRLLPVAVDRPADAPPIRYASADTLAAVAAREYLYATLTSVLLDALASEHGARLAATQAAEQWLDDRLATLRRGLTAARRAASTQEVIEIAGGARARAAAVATAPRR